MKSTVSVAKLKSGKFSVKAAGKHGGGWTKVVDERELVEVMIRAYQMYGSNAEGINYYLCTDVPAAAAEMADKLNNESLKMAGILVRLPDAEASIVRQAAESEGKSMNQWCREKLLK